MQNPNNNNRNRLIYSIPYIIVLVFIISMFFSNPMATRTVSLGYSEFQTAVEEDRIDAASVAVDYNTLTVSGIYTDAQGTSYEFVTVLPNTEN